MMRTSLALLLTALAHRAVSTRGLLLQWDPNTAQDCMEWYNNGYGKTCEHSLQQSSTNGTLHRTQNPTRPILGQNMNVNGDTSLTIPKCQNSCYRLAFNFAGVQEGDQCWCSSYVGGECAKNQTDCNSPCTGNEAETCGGKSVVNVFEALPNASPTATTTNSAIVKATPTNSTLVNSITTHSTSVKAAVASSGAVNNRVVLGVNF